MRKKVMVFGSYVTDLAIRQNGFPKDGETIKGNSFSTGPGGKGSNQAVAAFKAGADLCFITKLGDDLRGREALDFYEGLGMDTSHIFIEKGGVSGAALIMVDEATAQNRIIVYSGACGNITPEDTETACKLAESCDYLLMQLETNQEPFLKMLKHAHEHGLFTIVDPAPAAYFDPEYFQYIDLIKPNETEAGFFSNVEVKDFETASKAAAYFKSMGVKNVVITLGKAGAYANCDNEEFFVDSIDCGPTVDSTGAGDAFSGGLVAGLAEGLSYRDAVRFASITAGLSVTKKGTAPSMPIREEIDRIFNSRED